MNLLIKIIFLILMINLCKFKNKTLKKVIVLKKKKIKKKILKF